MTRKAHPKKDVEEALQHVEACGWRVSVGGGHARGKIYCPYNDKSCRGGIFCITSIWSTPKNPGTEALKIKRVADKCRRREGAGVSDA